MPLTAAQRPCASSALALIEQGLAVGLIPATVVAGSATVAEVDLGDHAPAYREVLSVTRKRSESDRLQALVAAVHQFLLDHGCLIPTR